MTFDRRTLLALPLAAGLAPAALVSDAAGQTRRASGRGGLAGSIGNQGGGSEPGSER
jgi:hypothetical protein